MAHSLFETHTNSMRRFMHDWAQEVQLYLFAKSQKYKSIFKRSDAALFEMTLQLFGRITGMVHKNHHGNWDQHWEEVQASGKLQEELPPEERGVQHWAKVQARPQEVNPQYKLMNCCG